MEDYSRFDITSRTALHGSVCYLHVNFMQSEASKVPQEGIEQNCKIFDRITCLMMTRRKAITAYLQNFRSYNESRILNKNKS